MAVDSGKDVIVAADARDVLGDAAWGACCHQIPHEQCRFPMNNWQTCWACDPGCYDAIRPTTPVAPIISRHATPRRPSSSATGAIISRWWRGLVNTNATEAHRYIYSHADRDHNIH